MIDRRFAEPDAAQPRAQRADTARATVLNILGDLNHPSERPAPTSAFIALMSQVGYSEHAVRQALTRSTANGRTTSVRQGRRTSWTLTSQGRELVEEGIAGVEGLSEPWTEWDGYWLVIVLTIPHSKRASRDRLYRALRQDGFGNPAPTVWLSPFASRRERVAKSIRNAGLTDTLAFVGQSDQLGLSAAQLVSEGWDTDSIAQTYRRTRNEFEAVSINTDEECAVSLLRLDSSLQELMVIDPRLPEILLPDWPGREDAKVLLQIRQRWRAAARRHWSNLVHECSR